MSTNHPICDCCKEIVRFDGTTDIMVSNTKYDPESGEVVKTMIQPPNVETDYLTICQWCWSNIVRAQWTTLVNRATKGGK